MSLISRTIYLPSRDADGSQKFEEGCSTEVPNLFTALFTSKQSLSFGDKFDTLRSLTPVFGALLLVSGAIFFSEWVLTKSQSRHRFRLPDAAWVAPPLDPVARVLELVTGMRRRH